MPAVSTYGPTADHVVNGLLSGSKWAVGSLTYSFPTSASFYGSPYGNGEPTSNFEAFNGVQQTATRTILKMYSSVANVQFTEVTESTSVHGDFRYAMSDKPGTAWAYYPSTAAEGGDAWFNNSKGYYDNPVKGNYGYLTIMHETGHALGLKHPHEVSGSFGAMPLAYDSLEYSVMSYRSYVGGPATAYTVGSTSYPQTLMMYDIAALQKMYGASYSTNGSDTIYTWSATTGEMSVNGVGQGAPAGDKIFMTVWDGGGVDTYDFSNYGTNLVVSLLPGGWTTVSTTQLAVLGSGKYAVGNIANTLLFEGNPASLIENVVGGSGSDMIVGNTAKNALTGGAGNDVLDGGAGVDTALYTGMFASYWIVENGDGSWTVDDQRSGDLEGTDTLWNIELLQFADLLYALGDFDPPPPPDPEPQPNEAPVAHDDVFSTSKSTRLTISGAGVLANDSDPDGDSLSAVLVNGTRNGTLNLHSDGSFVYTPRKNFVGTDSFTYRVSDGSMDDVATVTISVTGSTVGGKGKGKIHGPDPFDMQEEQLPAPLVADGLNSLRQLEGGFLPTMAWSGNGVAGASVLEQLAQAHAADFAHG